MESIIGHDGDGNKVYELSAHLTITVVVFEEVFGTSYDFETLISHEKATPSWQKIFKDLKNRGILK